jgi:hypothetical protein
MGDCNCKNKKNIDIPKGESSEKNKGFSFMKVIVFTTKIFLFLFSSVIATLIVIPFSIYMLFKVIFLNESIDLTSTLLSVGKALKKKDDDEDEYVFEDEDEIELLETQV